MSSEVESLSVSLHKFKPRTIDEFIGTWSTNDGDNEYSVEIEKTGESELTIKAFEKGGSLYSAIFAPTYIGWDEPIVAGHGNDGSIVLDVDLTTGVVTLQYQKMGLTTWGTYWYEADGVWDGFDMKISLVLDWFYAKGDLDNPQDNIGLDLEVIFTKTSI